MRLWKNILVKFTFVSLLHVCQIYWHILIVYLYYYWWWVESNSFRPCGRPWLDHAQVNSRVKKSSKKYHWKWISFVQRFWWTSKLARSSMSKESMDDHSTLSKFQKDFLQTLNNRITFYHFDTWEGFLEIRSIFSTNPTPIPWWQWIQTSRLTKSTL